MNMQAAMGKLTEAVESLKTESKEPRSELASISKEIHGYKVGLTWVLGLLGAIGALFAWFLNLYMEYHKH